MKRDINKATAIGFIIMSMVSIYLSSRIKSLEQDAKWAEQTKVYQSSLMLQEDSLCRVWVEDTAQRIAFKHWYKKQLSKTK